MGFFFKLGKAVGPKVRKGKWVWDSLTASAEDILRAEYDTGRDMAVAVLEQMPGSPDAEACGLVKRLGEQLAGRLTEGKRRWVFYCVEADTPNAWAVPGGFIFVTRSLVDLCERNPDEVAFILGHEVGHVVRGHSFDRLVSSTLLGAATRVTPVGRVLTPALLGMGVKLMQSAYTQDQELEADSFGARLAHSGGFDPRASLRMMQRLHENAGGDELPEVLAYFSTHPPFPVRMQALRKAFA